mmetsp:Transcript_24091/g.33683  ORF Transcript_24091/g.33683 Transcript_24091/m.33683 type:complete len:209 (-) Transcript_24091:208-834(-)
MILRVVVRAIAGVGGVSIGPVVFSTRRRGERRTQGSSLANAASATRHFPASNRIVQEPCVVNRDVLHVPPPHTVVVAFEAFELYFVLDAGHARGSPRVEDRSRVPFLFRLEEGQALRADKRPYINTDVTSMKQSALHRRVCLYRNIFGIDPYPGLSCEFVLFFIGKHPLYVDAPRPYLLKGILHLCRVTREDLHSLQEEHPFDRKSLR